MIGLVLWLFISGSGVVALTAMAVLSSREVQRLRSGIRAHRDARGNDRCWLDDEVLYRLLPETDKALTVLPDRETFLGNCARYHANRQHPLHVALFHGEHAGGVTPEERS